MVKWIREWLRGPMGLMGPPGPAGANGRDCIYKTGWASPVDIDGATNVLGPPTAWDEEKYGECTCLSVIMYGGRYISEWELPSGQRIRIHVESNAHPPIAIQAV